MPHPPQKRILRKHHLGAASVVGLLCLALLPTACDSNPAGPSAGSLDSLNVTPRETCSLPLNEVRDSVAKDAIPSLTNPALTDADDVDYLNDDDRVLGIEVGVQAIAVPHNILWWHEIVNFDFADLALAVTYCPLTGSSMAFDRAVIGGGEFGVSGLLFQNNLTMYDRTSAESLWPQMGRQAACGPRLGTRLTMIPVIEMTWEGWKTLYPETRVSTAKGATVAYTPQPHPYGAYTDPGNDALLYPLDIDGRHPPKARMLGIPNSREGGVAFLFSDLDNGEPLRVVHERAEEGPVVVFWNRAYESAMAYRTLHNETRLTFQVHRGRIIDTETRSEWRIDGVALAGPLAGARLEPVAEAYVAFWFAWAAFHPKTRIWEG